MYIWYRKGKFLFKMGLLECFNDIYFENYIILYYVYDVIWGIMYVCMWYDLYK